jgi:protein MAK11
MATSAELNRLPSKVIVAVGTYEGVIAGWELTEKKRLQLTFATPVHGGSVRSVAIAGRTAGNTSQPDVPGSLLSCGYDEVLRTHDFHRRLTSSGEVRIPADFAFGTPVCSSFAPPGSLPTGPVATHCLLGFSGGKLVIYKKRDWTVQHVLAGHDGGVASLAVHPSGKMALTAGTTDGKLKLWDLQKGRLAFASKIPPAATALAGRNRYDPIVSLVWSPDDAGSCYAFCHGSHVTVKHVGSGKDLMDVELPSRVNQVCFMNGADGLFVAAACNDGSLPVLAVETVDAVTDGSAERRAVMAIEPVDGPVAGEERFKCIQSVSGYYVVTANSAGVLSLVNLQGAVNMILTPDESSEDEDEEKPVHSDSDEDGDDDDVTDDENEEEELAAEIIDSVQLGSGARITCLAAWSYQGEPGESPDVSPAGSPAASDEEEAEDESSIKEEKKDTWERKRKYDDKEVTMDPEALERARSLVADAKKIQKKREKKKHLTSK